MFADALAVAGGVVLAGSIAADTAASIVAAAVGGLIGLILARRLPAVAVLAPAGALVAAINGVELDQPLGAAVLGIAVAGALRSVGLDALLAPVLPLGVVGLALVYDRPLDVVSVVLAAAVGLLLGAVIGPRPRREPVARSVGERARYLPILLLFIPIVLLAALLLPRLDRNSPSARSGDPDSTSGAPTEIPYPGFGGDLDVGEPVDLGNEVIMRVAADDATFWRVDTYADFDGRTWSGRAGTEDDLLVPTGSVAERFRQVFTIVRPLAGAVPTAYRPLGVATAGGIGRLRSDATIAPGAPFQAEERYVVTSVRQPVSADSLRRSRNAEDVNLGAELEALTEVDTTDRVRDLARRITAGIDNDYDKIRALEEYIADEVVYTRDIDTLPAGGDAVDHLLFESRRGFCEQIGTALVVLARSLGLPARLTVGYVPAERDALRGEWVVRQDNAHAWADVWFADGGWQGFDPTAAVPLAAESEADDGIGQVLWWVVAVAVALVVVVVGRLVWSRWRGRTADVDAWRSAAVTRFDAVAAALDVDSRATLLRSGRAIDERLALGSTPHGSIVSELLDRDAFGTDPLTGEERQIVETSLSVLEELSKNVQPVS